jgi:hypothetical protein
LATLWAMRSTVAWAHTQLQHHEWSSGMPATAAVTNRGAVPRRVLTVLLDIRALLAVQVSVSAARPKQEQR